MNSFSVWFHALEINIGEHLSNRLDPYPQRVYWRLQLGGLCGLETQMLSS